MSPGLPSPDGVSRWRVMRVRAGRCFAFALCGVSRATSTEFCVLARRSLSCVQAHLACKPELCVRALRILPARVARLRAAAPPRSTAESILGGLAAPPSIGRKRRADRRGGLAHNSRADARPRNWNMDIGLTCGALPVYTWASADDSRQVVLDCYISKSRSEELRRGGFLELRSKARSSRRQSYT